MKAHLVFVLVQLDVVQVPSESGRLQGQPALVQPRLQLLAVVEELKQPELRLQLPPPARGEETSEYTSECDVQ